MEVDFSEFKREIFQLLGDKKTMVLATSSDNRVTARNMSCVVIDKLIYFQTDKTFLKYQQILENPNIALCVDNIQIEGVAKIKKHPFDEENKKFLSTLEKSYKSSFDNYSKMKNEVVVKIVPTLITIWKYQDGQPFRDFLDISKKQAYREIYNTKL